MVKLVNKFSVGERVFAKVRGYPPWPAKIESITDPTSKQAKYHVVFFGTKEIGTCKIEDLFRYAENKDKFSKTVRRKYFHEGIEELEEDLRKNPNPTLDDSGKGSDTEAIENVPENAADDSTVASNDSMNQPTTGDEDTDAGNLVIDETDKKKTVKRKSHVVPNTPDVTEVKKKRGRKSMATILAENSAKLDAKLDTTSQDSQDEDSDKKVSRSGRKIKPKRFHDSIDAEISIDSSRNEHSARSRTKSKTEDSNENQDIVTPIKKRMGIENDKKTVLIDSVEAEQNQSKLKTLRLESHILFLDTQIRSSLGLDKANVNDCLDALDQLLEYEITPLMLKKHSHIVETIKRLRRYIGNLPDWKLSEEETIVFKQKAEQIKKKAEEIYSKFRTLFEISEGESFWHVFVKQLEEFKKHTAHLNDEELFSLLVDPTESSKLTKVEEVTSLKKETAVESVPQDSVTGTSVTEEAEAKE
ncbi:PC4 and SFRS1-interacting protein isoform X2 [Phymastichus coffea]|uniref:PC4 and SFRS1-interacting protein isoform X2 n=1 Tax=Phymastichus coffea TaxID=108790 RepID=UPI00273B501F|nr:PC4 and SFRS1-interacting protein isoform X2 [Phymastichus coffea]